MEKIITYKVSGQLFDHEETALCFEAIMLMRTMVCRDPYQESCEAMFYTDEQLEILLDLIETKYNKYQIPIEYIISDWRGGKINFSKMTINQIRGFVEDKMSEII